MKKLAILVPTVALIFACSSNTSLQAGQWEMTPKITDIQIDGAPPGAAEQAKQMMAGAMRTQSRCMSAQEAANPAEGLASAGSGGAQGCNFTKRTFEGGRIDMAATCQTPAGQSTNTFTGTYTATTMDMQIQTQAAVMGRNMRTTITMTGRRTGDCAG